MSDLYSEWLVKKEKTAKDSAVKYGLIVLLILSVAAGLFINPIALIVTIVLAVVCYFVFPRLDLEYEYLFVNGELDIDVVMAKTKRKRVRSLDMGSVDLVAPVNSHRMDYYNGNTRMKTADYSSGNPEHKRFALIVRDQNDTLKVVIEPDEAMAQAIQKSAPSKVFLD